MLAVRRIVIGDVNTLRADDRGRCTIWVVPRTAKPGDVDIAMWDW